MDSRVFFDLDGTLTDPFDGIARSIRYALGRLDVDPPGDDELRDCIGPPLLESFRSMVGNERAAEALRLYRERFSEIGWRENCVYPGIDDALTELAGSGMSLFVATSKPQVYARRIVEHFDLSPYFENVFGAELDGTRGDKTELLGHALDNSGSTARAAMIGDRRHDIIGALNNDMDAIGVAWGYGSVEELRDAGARAVAERPSELPDLLKSGVRVGL